MRTHKAVGPCFLCTHMLPCLRMSSFFTCLWDASLRACVCRASTGGFEAL